MHFQVSFILINFLNYRHLICTIAQPFLESCSKPHSLFFINCTSIYISRFNKIQIKKFHYFKTDEWSAYGYF